MKWIEKHIGLMVLLFLCIFAIEIGIGVWRMPKEFRSGIIPKLNNIIEMQRGITKQQKEFKSEWEEFVKEHEHDYSTGKPRLNKNVLNIE